MCGETGRISRVESFIVKLIILSTKMMSSFDLCQVLLSLNCRRRTIAWDTKISLTMRANLRDGGKTLGDNGKTLGRCCLRRMKCGRIFGHMTFEALKSRTFPIVDACSSWTRIHLSRRRRRLYHLSRPPEAKIDAFRVVQNRQNSIKIHFKPLKIDKNSF